MKLSFMGIFEIEGKPEQLAVYTAVLMSALKQMQERDEKTEIQKNIDELFRTIDEQQKHTGKAERG